MDIAGRTIWITGASSGIGEALALALANADARLVLSSRREAELERVRRACRNPERHVLAPLDISRTDMLAGTVGDVLARVGHLDVLVNNAGVSQRATAADATLAAERALMDVNYFGPVALTKALLPHFRSRRAGHVVVVSSVMGHVGTPGRSTYAAAKHALHGYFDSLRAELWPENIAVTLVCPGYVRTAVAANALGPDGRPGTASARSAERGIPAERCAATIVRAIRRRPREVYVGGWEVAGIYLQRFVPGLLARIVRSRWFAAPAAGGDRPAR